MTKFIIIESNGKLLIRQKKLSLSLDLTIEFIDFLFSMCVWICPFDELIETHQILWLVYFIPLLPFYKLAKKILKILSGFQIELNPKSNQLLINHRFVDNINHLAKVEWNIDSTLNHDLSYLELNSLNDIKYRVSTTSNFMNKEHYELGKTIAKFLNIDFVNNNPLEKEVLYYGKKK